MFENIDDIDWHRKEHAYGAADDVPALLRALASRDAMTRRDAIHKLFGNIWHQGTVFEATIYAIPYLIDLLTSPEVEDKSAIAYLLASVANGYGFLEVHAQPDSFESDWRLIYAKQGKSFETEIVKESAIVRRVRDAAKDSLPAITPYLSDLDAETRGTVALALSRYPELSDQNLPLIINALESEQDSDARRMFQRAIDRFTVNET